MPSRQPRANEAPRCFGGLFSPGVALFAERPGCLNNLRSFKKINKMADGYLNGACLRKKQVPTELPGKSQDLQGVIPSSSRKMAMQPRTATWCALITNSSIAVPDLTFTNCMQMKEDLAGSASAAFVLTWQRYAKVSSSVVCTVIITEKSCLFML